MTISIAVAGASGYAGGEVLRLLLDHPGVRSGEIEIGALTANSSAGEPLGTSHPHLLPLADRVLEETTPETLAGHDVVFLGLPHGHSGAIAAQLADDVLVIDLGADHRLESAEAWEKYYGTEHSGTWPYGLPELPGQRKILADTKRIAVPGCFPTGATLALLPGITAGLFGGQISIVSVTGSSGAGKAAKVPMLHAEVHGSAKAYGVAVHRHIPEIAQNVARLAGVAETPAPTVSFTPVLAPMARGILTTAVIPTEHSVEAIRAAYEDAYAGEPFVHVLPAGQQPMTASVLGSNVVQIGVEVDASAGVAIVTSVIDNLAKGTAGGAIQSMNLALGLPETDGLPLVGIAP
ncbi:N-acetyl-gamma-glutamyl-phosphate reductase [Dietzia sp.]|uniref:N-acetyl-gamma-glutamyl-phosphate reductase n=1 Tax=Dietzia sp. TaxID=1871616 RepID=UPI002FDA7474